MIIYRFSNDYVVHGRGMGCNVGTAKSYARKAITEAKTMVEPKSMLGAGRSVHRAVVSEKQWVPGINRSTLQDHNEGIRVSSTATRGYLSPGAEPTAYSSAATSQT